MHVRESIPFKVRRELFEERGSRLEYTFFGLLYYSLGVCDPERNLLKKLEESVAFSRPTIVRLRKDRSNASVEREIELPISKQWCAIFIDRSINQILEDATILSRGGY